VTALIPLWIVFAVLVGVTVLCFRATRVEKAEGLTPSTKRLAVAAVAALITGGVAIFASTLRAEPPPAAAEKNDAATIEAKKKLEGLQAQQIELQKQIDELVVKIGAPKTVSKEELEKQRAEMQLLALQGSLLVMLLALGGVFFLGDPRTLLLKRRKTDGPGDPLDAMARACAGQRWDEARRAAATVEEAKLDGLDLIDFLYLRGIALAAEKKHEDAQKDLAKVAALAPNMVEAHWALGTAYFGGEKFGEAAEAYARAADLDKEGAFPTKKARSAALVRHGERRLAEADVDAAAKCFDEVTKLGVFTKEIPAALMSHRLASILGDLRSDKLKEAREGIALVREAKSGEGLDPERKRIAETTCSVYEMLLLHKEEEHRQILEKLPFLLTAWQPANLPEPTEEAADEYLFAAVDAEKLADSGMRAEVFRALWFLVAVAEVRALFEKKTPPSDVDVARIARPLFRALQFEPRHREVLAALGVLYYLFVPVRREKAMEWIDAAVAMGTTSRIARRLLELDRSRETERTALLAHFRGAATRFLGDAMVDPKVRAALLEELGRFQDFRPVLVDLDNQAEIGHEAPTLAALKERVQYIQGVAATAEQGMPPDTTRALRAIRDEYDAVVNTLELSASRVSDLERRVMEEVGKMVLR
jgi:tetratricopeptide (TPR) repeat protein